VVDEKGDIARAAVAGAAFGTKGDAEVEDERRLLTDCLDLLERESAANKRRRTPRRNWRARSLEVRQADRRWNQDLVVDDKWLAAFGGDVRSELDRVSQALSDRVRQIG